MDQALWSSGANTDRFPRRLRKVLDICFSTKSAFKVNDIDQGWSELDFGHLAVDVDVNLHNLHNFLEQNSVRMIKFTLTQCKGRVSPHVKTVTKHRNSGPPPPPGSSTTATSSTPMDEWSKATFQTELVCNTTSGCQEIVGSSPTGWQISDG